MLGGFVCHPPIIVKEIGEDYLREAAATVAAMKRLAADVKAFAPDVLVMSTPHNEYEFGKVGVLTEANLSGDFSMFRHRELRYRYSNRVEIVEKMLADGALRPDLVPIRSGVIDHGCLVFLDYLEHATCHPDLVILSMTWGEADTFLDFGRRMAAFFERERTGKVAYVASGDLSHCAKEGVGREFHPEGPVFDGICVEALKTKDVSKILGLDARFLDRAQQCGMFSMLAVIGFFEDAKYTSEVLSYEAPFGVGYAVGKFSMN
jgi:aromatic ring-opening dioxygenase LigB subunit